MSCKHDFHWYLATNEDGWRCVNCDYKPGEPPGFDPKLDRSEIEGKVDAVMLMMHHAELIHVSNGSHGDYMTGVIAQRCRDWGRFDQYTIVLLLLRELSEAHAVHWREISEAILAGKDKRDRCPCGELSTMSVSSGGGAWIRRCRDWRRSMREDLEDPGTLGALERAVKREQPQHVIVCGGRDFKPRDDDGARLCAYLHRKAPCVVHHGDARGADRWAAALASRMEGVTVVAHPADWDAHGNAAGPKRNAEMLRAAKTASKGVVLIAYPGGRGTSHMVEIATKAGCQIVRPHGEEA